MLGKLSIKQLNNLMLVMIFAVSVLLVLSAIAAIIMTKKLADSKAQDVQVPVSMPMLSFRDEPYSQQKYADLQLLVNPDASVKIEAKADGMSISSAKVESEFQWRLAVLKALSIDKNLDVVKVCGSVANACSGNALFAELTGGKRVFFVNNQSEVSK